MGRRAIILTDMKTRRAGWRVVLLSVIVALAGSSCVAADSAARLAATFADTYAAFAPLFSFYQSYADHLFQGTDVEIPDSIALACAAFPKALGFLHLEIQTQTASSSLFTMPALVHLRSDAAGFCTAFEPRLEEMDTWIEVDPEMLRQASEEGLFAAISQLNDGLDLVFTEMFDGFSAEEARWRFAVTFAVRAILVSETVERLNSNLREILYGDAEAEAPPLSVSEAVGEAMALLIALSGKDLNADEAESAWAAAEIVYHGFMEIPEAESAELE